VISHRTRKIGFHTVLLEPRFFLCPRSKYWCGPPIFALNGGIDLCGLGGRRSLHRERKPSNQTARCKYRCSDRNIPAANLDRCSLLQRSSRFAGQICWHHKGWGWDERHLRGGFRKDFSKRRPIWTPATVGDKVFRSIEGEVINVDPTGQWVAWDLLLEPRMNPRCIAIKSTSDDPRRRQPH